MPAGVAADAPPPVSSPDEFTPEPAAFTPEPPAFTPELPAFTAELPASGVLLGGDCCGGGGALAGVALTGEVSYAKTKTEGLGP